MLQRPPTQQTNLPTRNRLAGQEQRPPQNIARVYVPPRYPEKRLPHILSESQRMRAMQAQVVRQPAMRVPQPAPGYGVPAQMIHKKQKRHSTNWLLIGGMMLFGVMLFLCVGIMGAVLLISNSGVLPGVHVAGVSLGGMSVQEAQAALNANWTQISVRDGAHQWNVNPAWLGIQLDAAATAKRAHDQGRGEGSFITALMGAVDVAPIVGINFDALNAGLQELAGQVETPAVNAGVELVNGVVQATAAHNGRQLDTAGTAALIQRDGGEALADGVIDLVMVDTFPAVTDSTPMVAAASALLANPLNVRVYDPMTGDMVVWSAPPEMWASWLTAVPNGSSPMGLALSLQSQPVQDFLTTNATVFDSSRYLNMDEAVQKVQDTISVGNTTATLRVYHHDLTHIVQAGDTIVSIAWDYGVPYPWIQQANPGVTSLSVGQTITIPSVDNFLPFEVVADKRIVVSISQQRTWVYENGELKWEWASSTGIDSSPTWPGVYQIISHEENAYAGNWNLWMPYFIGVYQPIPGADFTNGFHGFPTRGGGQLLWENSLGYKVTYGCILLSNTNVIQLYEWAEEGVVVEIQR